MIIAFTTGISFAASMDATQWKDKMAHKRAADIAEKTNDIHHEHNNMKDDYMNKDHMNDIKDNHMKDMKDDHMKDMQKDHMNDMKKDIKDAAHNMGDDMKDALDMKK